MALATWPGGVPIGVVAGTYTEKPERYVSAHKPPIGQGQERMRSRILNYAIGFDQKLTSDEFDALLTFYRTTLVDGVLPFNRAHPRTGLTAKFKFTAEPQLRGPSGALFIVAMQLRQLP